MQAPQYQRTFHISKLKDMSTTTIAKKDPHTNKVTFWRNGNQVFDFTISGNIVSFSTGEMILI